MDYDLILGFTILTFIGLGLFSAGVGVGYALGKWNDQT